MKRRDMKLLLEERFERISLLETRIDTMDQLVEGYRAREQSIFDTLEAAKTNAAKALEQAQAEGAQLRAEAEAVLADAEALRANARAEAEALLADAISAANMLKTEAERKGIEMTASIKADSERMLRDAEIIKREYEEMVDSFNAMLEQNASELEITAARFGEFVKNRKIDRTETRLDGSAFYKSVGELSDANLPDASGDPSQMMQNIYRIQNRPLPEDRMETVTQEAKTAVEPVTAQATTTEKPTAQAADTTARTPQFPIDGSNGADAQQEALYSKAAWVNEAQQSNTEPQAEFIRAFDEAFARSDYTIHTDACLTQADALSAFDALVDGSAIAGAASDIPLGSADVVANIAAQPQQEMARAVDEYFDEAFDPGAKTAQDQVPQDKEEGPEGAAPNVTQEQTAPEPYSEQAWTQSTAASENEPQAEGALFDDASNFTPEPMRQFAPVAPAAAAYMPSSPIEAPASEPVLAGEAERALDDYLAQIDAFVPTVPSAPATAIAPEPYSERAWEQSTAASEYEPQAEGALYIDTYTYTPESMYAATPFTPEVPASYDTVPAKETVSASEAEHEFDDYLAQINAFAPTVPNAPATAIAPEPYSERAWEQSAAASAYEPQAEGALFGDANNFAPEPMFAATPIAPETPASYDTVPANKDVSATDAEHEFDDYLAQINAFAPAASTPEPARTQPAKEAVVAAEPVSTSEAEHALDDYLAQMYAFAPTVPNAPVTATAPEPYSERAWEQSAAASAYEPQAEGASHLSGTEPEEEEEPEPAPAPRRYNDYGEIREWEPEPEPEMGDIPTVSRYMGESGGSNEISLDDLLDEIIKAGE